MWTLNSPELGGLCLSRDVWSRSGSVEGISPHFHWVLNYWLMTVLHGDITLQERITMHLGINFLSPHLHIRHFVGATEEQRTCCAVRSGSLGDPFQHCIWQTSQMNRETSCVTEQKQVFWSRCEPALRLLCSGGEFERKRSRWRRVFSQVAPAAAATSSGSSCGCDCCYVIIYSVFCVTGGVSESVFFCFLATLSWLVESHWERWRWLLGRLITTSVIPLKLHYASVGCLQAEWPWNPSEAFCFCLFHVYLVYFRPQLNQLAWLDALRYVLLRFYGVTLHVATHS